MSKRKDVPRKALGMDDTEMKFFSSAITDVNLDPPVGFEKEQMDDILENIPFARIQDSRYSEWCDGFITLLKRDEKYRDALNALRQMRQYNVHIGFTVRGIFDFVCMELYTDDILNQLKQFNSARGLTAGRLQTIKNKMSELEQYCANEPERILHSTVQNSRTLLEVKKALIAMIDQGLNALDEIYTYELKHSDVESYRDNQSAVRANHLRFILPPENFFKDQRWWPELAEIMTATAAVVISKGWSLQPGRAYSKVALQSLNKDFTDERRKKLRAHFTEGLKDFFERIETQLPSEVMRAEKQNVAFSPTPESALITELAEALRDGNIRRVDKD